MNYLTNFLNTTTELNIYIIVFVAIIYIVIHHFRHKPLLNYLDIILNYIPVLTHEFGHVLFNKIAGGRAKDLVIVTSPRERQQTLQQGFVVTQSRHLAGQWLTTLGGYLMPPLMLLIGLASSHYQIPSIFIFSYLLIFIYFLILTSRKGSPIIVITLISIMLYFILKDDNILAIQMIVTISYQFILGVLLGEVLQSSWTIAKLTIQRPSPQWDGSALKDLSHVPIFIYSTIWIIFNLYAVNILLKYTHLIS
ncbi:M50 family metallopeptidase [Staphylococcus argenteus]|uniref:M50 family metallopeptidase n=1 Tax=Staphylococcus argenteus TaxID=985002 RepID=UPI001FB8BC63|nr:M50 family metallopeptidase [Staphylococcus argenteus]MCG9796085.1 M50 family metallopeptidase [Staphylococcus argenteus]GJF44563.1 M50 family metallopeptidase [Staphylococcus argenteus]GJF54990.1 M50 family metallopeptidase [Staphylococcus argenteus]GJF58549.1 M50 family metallopeptidase [Staphylococcus argenteus]GJF71429.1 M50 family metallopeptidase [Staphylococcus argenteus]